MTVSRVLRGQKDVSTKTRETVLAAAKELGYVANRIAGALASQTVNLVAVIVPSMSNLVFPKVISGIYSGLDGSGLQPVIGITGYDPTHEETVVYDMLSWRPSGIIIAGTEHSDATRKMLKAANVPVVEIMDVDGDPIDFSVGISHRKAGRQMAQEILKAQYKKIGFIGTKMPLDHRARKRFEGFTEGLTQGKLEIKDRAFYNGGSSLSLGRDLTKQLLERTPDLDFIYCSNDILGAGALMQLQDMGYSIPADIGVAGFNRLELLEGLSLDLATTDASRHETGKTAAKIIVNEHTGQSTSPKRQEFPPRFVAGETLKRTKS
ncbi:MAG: LacI family DNA-binding transcriptional regulator [Halocynthiibacter sp.]